MVFVAKPYSKKAEHCLAPKKRGEQPALLRSQDHVQQQSLGFSSNSSSSSSSGFLRDGSKEYAKVDLSAPRESWFQEFIVGQPTVAANYSPSARPAKRRKLGFQGGRR